MVARLRSLYAFALFSSYAVSLCFEVLLSPCFPLVPRTKKRGFIIVTDEGSKLMLQVSLAL
jgi:hypothetical protein